MNTIRRLFAAILLLGIVVGAPVALWVFGRDLLPDHVPSRTEVGAFFTQRDTGALFLGALVLIGVVAWLIFTISVLIELAALMAGRRGQWRIPGFRIPQRAAGALIAVVFTATFAVATAMPASAAAPSVVDCRRPAVPAPHRGSPGPISGPPSGHFTGQNRIEWPDSIHAVSYGPDVDCRPVRHSVANRRPRARRRFPLPRDRRPQQGRRSGRRTVAARRRHPIAGRMGSPTAGRSQALHYPGRLSPRSPPRPSRRRCFAGARSGAPRRHVVGDCEAAARQRRSLPSARQGQSPHQFR